MKNESVKLPFVAKNSKHLVATSGDDSSAQIEFTPCEKQECQITPGNLKRKFDWLFIVDPI